MGESFKDNLRFIVNWLTQAQKKMRAALREDEPGDAPVEDMRARKRNPKGKSKGRKPTEKGPETPGEDGSTPAELEAEDQEIRDAADADLGLKRPRCHKGRGRGRGRGSKKRQHEKDSRLTFGNWQVTSKVCCVECFVNHMRMS